MEKLKFLYLLSICQVIFCDVRETSVSPTIVSREEWGARPPKNTPENLTIDPPPYVIIHHSATRGCNSRMLCEFRVKSFQNYHMNDKGWDDIGYNFLVGEDGYVYEGRGWHKRGAHSKPYNAKSIGICMIGDFKRFEPNPAALEALQALIAYGVTTEQIEESYILLGHRQTTSTDCPGDTLYSLIKTWPNWSNIGYESSNTTIIQNEDHTNDTTSFLAQFK